MNKDASFCSLCELKRRSRCPTCFEWIQLLVTFSVPLAIALYTFFQNNNEQVIALANREKDLEIARQQRAQDLQLADDQQKANILAGYETFLVGHLNRYGMNLDGSSSARFVARLKTLTTINQLDLARKTFLIRSLFEAKLIVNQPNMTDRQGDAIISLKEANLSDMNFDMGLLSYIALSQTNLTRADFHFAQLLCVHFHSAILIEANFHNADIPRIRNSCFNHFGYTMFSSAIMSKVNLSQAQFIATDFSNALLDYANMHEFLCLDCLFFATKIYRSDMSSSMISTNSILTLINITQSILHSMKFKEATFQYGVFSESSGIGMIIEHCLFTFTVFERCVMHQASIKQSNFTRTSFNHMILTESIVTNVQFINTTIYSTNLTSTIFNQCVFIHVNFTNSIMWNASFFNSTFQESFITDEQRLKAASFQGSVFI